MADSEQEVEVWWGGYAGRTMLPLFSLCMLVTAAILLAARLIWREESGSGLLIARLALYLVVSIWTAALGRWAYLTCSVGYRLTSRRLLHERGFRHPARPAIDLARVRRVQIEQHAWERWVGVGRLRLELDDGRAEVLPGIANPQDVAAEIVRRVRQASGASGEERGV